MNRRAKIVATIGPACDDKYTMVQLLELGVDVARLNFSHGDHGLHAQVVALLRQTAAELDRPLCILQDLQGPKIRTGKLKDGEARLERGASLTLTTNEILGTGERVSIDFPGLPKAVKPGGRILLDDGNLELEVVSTSEDAVETKVILGGTLKPNKGVNLPGAKLEIPSMTEKDEADLEFGLSIGVDTVALSFVRTARDVEYLRSRIAALAPDRPYLPIIAKLERPEALDNLEEIMKAADGVMVARGDLGVEMPPEMVPLAQKRIIETANRFGKSVITATQMLDSMIHNPRPTRAEASDVANAILDGSDAVMLSGETAAGGYPVKSVEMMDAIIRQIERNGEEWFQWKGSRTVDAEMDDSYFITLAARELAHDRNVAAIAVFTTSGRTARLMSKTRPHVPILGLTPREHTRNLMMLYWGVTPHLVPEVVTVKELVPVVDQVLLETTEIERGQQVIITCGFPVNRVRATNLVLLHTVGDQV